MKVSQHRLRWLVHFLISSLFLGCMGILVASSPKASLAFNNTAWISKPLLSHYLLSTEVADQIQSELDFSERTISSLIAIAQVQERQLQALDLQGERLIANPGLSMEQKKDLLQEFVFNQKFDDILSSSQDQVQQLLKPAEYSRLVAWLEEHWLREQLGSLEPAAKKYPRSFEVYATRYEAGDKYIVALPDKCVKFANNGSLLCNSGYQYGQNYSVAISYKGKIVVATVAESGPWNIDDNYWSKLSDPQPRRMFADLPLGIPAAQAAYFNGYNGGLDQFGRKVISPVAIDISYAVAKDLGLPSGNNKVMVSFLWTEGWDSTAVDSPSAQPGSSASDAPITFELATPRADGSIVHIVRSGQTLVGIANVYEIKLEDLLTLNNLTMQSIIQPGDEILVKEPLPTATFTPLPSPKPPTSTPKPTSTASPAALLVPTNSFTSTPNPLPLTSQPLTLNPLQIALLVVVSLLGIGLLVWGLISQRKNPE
jgi:hypothetical protein